MAEQNTTSGRPWTWTPSPVMNTFMATVLRTPLLHRMLSGSMLLITFTGRKSGQRYTTPVGYMREGATVLILTKQFRKWWRNFADPAPVELYIARQHYQGQAIALTDEATMLPHLTRLIAHEPRNASIYGVRIENGQPNADDVRALAPKVVLIQVTLAAPA